MLTHRPAGASEDQTQRGGVAVGTSCPAFLEARTVCRHLSGVPLRWCRVTFASRALAVSYIFAPASLALDVMSSTALCLESAARAAGVGGIRWAMPACLLAAQRSRSTAARGGD